ncbi:MAG TPA: TIGR03936 family radical SAM-associated protein [Acidimicrobiales bacterium]
MRIRLRFTKLGKVRWTSHRDAARLWERALRRAQVPLAYTEGFSPRPKVSFGLALPTGAESDAEYLDVNVRPERDVDLSTLPDRLTAGLPSGMACTAAVGLDPPVSSLQQVVTSCSWVLGARVPAAEAERRVSELLAADSVPFSRVRKGKETTDDLRPAVRELAVVGNHYTEGFVALRAELATQPRAVKPIELLAALWPSSGDDVAGWPLRRTHQWIGPSDAGVEPITLDAPEESYAPARAS